MTQKTKELLIRIKQDKPFILNVTNYFPMDLIDSGLRSIGAFPIMSNAEQEIDELLGLAKSVVINLGRLNDEFIALSHRICQIANAANKPIVLDPVGAGASLYRTDTAINLIKNHKISIVRGYPNEISGLLSEQLTIQNNNSIDNNIIVNNAKLLSKKHDIAVVVSGRINTVIDSNNMKQFNYDSFLLHKVAGIGSLLSSIIGAFHAIEQDRFTVATTAVDFYANCVGVLVSKASGPGSLRTALIDQLYINSTEAVNW